MEEPWGETVSLRDQWRHLKKAATRPALPSLTGTPNPHLLLAAPRRFSRGCSPSAATSQGVLWEPLWRIVPIPQKPPAKFPCGFLLPVGSPLGQSRVAAQAPALPLLSGPMIFSPLFPPGKEPTTHASVSLLALAGKDGKITSYTELPWQQRKGRGKGSERRRGAAGCRLGRGCLWPQLPAAPMTGDLARGYAAAGARRLSEVSQGALSQRSPGASWQSGGAGEVPRGCWTHGTASVPSWDEGCGEKGCGSPP